MLDDQDVFEVLRSVPVFSGIPRNDLVVLAAQFQVVEVPAGESVFQEGDQGDCMSIVVRGMVRLHRGGRDIKKLGPGEIFGEMALFDSVPRNASVSAVKDTTLLSLDKAAFLDVLHNRIEVALGMLRVLIGKLNQSMGTIERLQNFVEQDLLPLGLALSTEKNLDRLLERILEEAKKHSGADSGAIYLLNQGKMVVAFMFCESQAIDLCPVAAGQHLYPVVPLLCKDCKRNVTSVVAFANYEGRAVNLTDIYEAKQFDAAETKAHDAEVGYRSKSCLTVPLKDYDDKVIGVVELLNAIDPDTGSVAPFGAYEQLVVESLASLAAVALNTTRLLKRQREFLKVEHDLEIGRQIQLDFLPDELPQPPGWEIGARFEPARQVGGDFYDVFATAGGRIALVIADVCDKGVGAALFMALSRSLIRAFAWIDGKQADSQQVPDSSSTTMVTPSIDLALGPVSEVNEYLTKLHLKMNMFVTLFFGLLDPSSGTVTYINAGHNAPILLAGNGTLKARLGTTGPALGMIPGARFHTGEVRMESGDFLLTFTDGVTEARSPTRAFYTDERLVTLLTKPRSSANGLLDQIEEDVKQHVAGVEASDDITMLAVRRAPVESQRSVF